MSKMRVTLVVESEEWGDFDSPKNAANHLADELYGCYYVDSVEVESVEELTDENPA
jgi:hypothetical protein